MQVLATQTQTGGTGTNPLTIAHTAHADTKLIAAVICSNDVGGAATATWDGAAMEINQLSSHVYICWIYDPAIGGSKNLVLDPTVDLSSPSYSILDLSAGDPAVAEVVGTNTGTGSPATVAITPTRANGIILFGINAQWNAAAGPVGTGQVLLFERDLGLDMHIASYELNSVAAANNPTYAHASADPGWNAAAVWIAEPLVSLVPQALIL